MRRNEFLEEVSEFWEEHGADAKKLLVVLGLCLAFWAFAYYWSIRHPVSEAEMQALLQDLASRKQASRPSAWIIYLVGSLGVVLAIGLIWTYRGLYGLRTFYWIRTPDFLRVPLTPAAWRFHEATKGGCLAHSQPVNHPDYSFHRYDDLLLKKMGQRPDQMGAELPLDAKSAHVAMVPRWFFPLGAWCVWVVGSEPEIRTYPGGKAMPNHQEVLRHTRVSLYGRFESFRSAWRFRKLLNEGLQPREAFEMVKGRR